MEKKEDGTRARERVKIMTACSSLRFPNEKGRERGREEGSEEHNPIHEKWPLRHRNYVLPWVRRASRSCDAIPRRLFQQGSFQYRVALEALLPEVLTTTVGQCQ